MCRLERTVIPGMQLREAEHDGEAPASDLAGGGELDCLSLSATPAGVRREARHEIAQVPYGGHPRLRLDELSTRCFQAPVQGGDPANAVARGQ
jgi:hypothetical protein